MSIKVPRVMDPKVKRARKGSRSSNITETSECKLNTVPPKVKGKTLFKRFKEKDKVAGGLSKS